MQLLTTHVEKKFTFYKEYLEVLLKEYAILSVKSVRVLDTWHESHTYIYIKSN